MQLLEDRDDVGDHVLVHDELAAVRLPVEADVVHLDPTQQLRTDGAPGPPRRTEIGDGDRVDDSGRRLCRVLLVGGAGGVVVDRVVVVDDEVVRLGGGPGLRHCSRVAPMVASTTTMAIRR